MSAKSRKFNLASLVSPVSINTLYWFFYFPPVEPVISHKSASAWSGVKNLRHAGNVPLTDVSSPGDIV